MSAKDDDRKKRLSEALRSNLRRRKAQSRGEDPRRLQSPSPTNGEPQD